MGRTIYVTFRERDKTHLKAKCPNCGHESFDVIDKSKELINKKDLKCQECGEIRNAEEWKYEKH